MERLNHIEDSLVCCIEKQMNNLYEVNTKELSKAIKMVESLEKAKYYHCLTKQHENKEEHDDPYKMKSERSKKSYMEAKEKHSEKAIILRELEKYVQDLSQEIIEMISDSGNEEKQYLEKRLTSLASKIGQMND